MLPVLVVDFEASCLGEFSYPIEAGIARWDGPGRAIVTWSSLIMPQPRWISHGDWTWEAQQVHGISPSDLERGLSPHDVVSGMRNVSAGVGRALCDGGEHDMRWLVRLTMASGWPHLPFGLDDFDQMTMSLDADRYATMLATLEATPTPHRAGPDAVRLAQAVATALNGQAVDVITLADRDVLPDS